SSLLPPGEGGAKRRMRVRVRIDAHPIADPHPPAGTFSRWEKDSCAERRSLPDGRRIAALSVVTSMNPETCTLGPVLLGCRSLRGNRVVHGCSVMLAVPISE